jgi:hypothetical protein
MAEIASVCLFYSEKLNVFTGQGKSNAVWRQAQSFTGGLGKQAFRQR